MKVIIITALLVASLCVCTGNPGHFEPDRITALPGYKGPTLEQYSGYVNVDKAHNRNIFYWFIKSLSPTAATDPVVFWFQGGPGCSGLAGLMSENGPFRVKSDLTVDFFDLSWLRYANVVWLEQPAGVGFSYSDDPRDYNTNDTRAARDSHYAIKGWLEKFPAYNNSDLWLTGESYGGIYIPTTARDIIDDAELNHHLKGLMLGNPVVGCNTRNGISVELFYYHGLVGYSRFHAWLQAGCNTDKPGAECNSIENTIFQEVGVIQQAIGKNAMLRNNADTNYPSLNPDDLYYDFCSGNGTLSSGDSVAPCDPYGSNYVKYFNQAEVQAAIHAKPTAWSVCSSKINYNSNAGSMLPYYESFFKDRPDLHILVYSGDVDIATVPFAFTQPCLFQLSATKDRKTNWGPWFVRGHTAGYFESFERYTYATVKGAGHETPKFEPLFAGELFRRFLQSKDIKQDASVEAVDYEPAPVSQGDIVRAMGLH